MIFKLDDGDDVVWSALGKEDHKRGSSSRCGLAPTCSCHVGVVVVSAVVAQKRLLPCSLHLTIVKLVQQELTPLSIQFGGILLVLETFFNYKPGAIGKSPLELNHITNSGELESGE